MKSSSPAASDKTLASTPDGNSESEVASIALNVGISDVETNSRAHVSPDNDGLSASTSVSQLDVTPPELSSVDSSKSRKRRFEDDTVDGGIAPSVSSSSGSSLQPKISLGQGIDDEKKVALGTETDTTNELDGNKDHPAKKRRVEVQSGSTLPQEVEQSVDSPVQNSPSLSIGTDVQAATLAPSTSEVVASKDKDHAVHQEKDIPTALGQSLNPAPPLPETVTPKRVNENGTSTTDGPPPSKKPRLDGNNLNSATAPAEVNLATSTGSLVQPDGIDAIKEPASTPKGPPFLALPIELLAEMLILTGSPQHVLAVARTCKALCHTLLSPNAQFIWREARKGPGCTFIKPGSQPTAPATNITAPTPTAAVPDKIVRLPDPPLQFFSSEAAYAAFIFDCGTCDCCNKETNMMYGSFALKARVCKSGKCTIPKGLASISLRDAEGQILKTILPENESQAFNSNGSFVPYQTNTSSPGRYVRQDALDAAREKYPNPSDPIYDKKFEVLRTRKQEWMTLCRHLNMWKKWRQERYHQNKAKNEIIGKQIANKYGWIYEDVVNCTVYGPYQRGKAKLIEKVKEEDVKAMRDSIEEMLLSTGERRGRRSAEISLMENRAGVEALYNRLRTAGQHPYLPSLSAFRSLPVITMIQTTERTKTTKSIADMLQSNPVMTDLLNTQLAKWTEMARQDLGAVLGFPKNWKNASKNILHPVERLTGRFVCTRCERVDVKYRGDECLDFAGACRHECGVGNEKKGRIRKGKKGKWEASNFVKDEKAIKVLKTCAELSGYAEDRDGGNYLLKIGCGVVCKSCDPPMVLDSRNVIGHCHRHDEMQPSFESMEKLTSYLGGYPYEYGLVQKLMGPTSKSADTKNEIEQKNFGCRHCLRKKLEVEAAAAAVAAAAATASTNQVSDIQAQPAPPPPPSAKLKDASKPKMVELRTLVSHMHDITEGPLERPPPLYGFNGMRSHLKGKHGIESIRDEDILCYRSPLI